MGFPISGRVTFVTGHHLTLQPQGVNHPLGYYSIVASRIYLGQGYLTSHHKTKNIFIILLRRILLKGDKVGYIRVHAYVLIICPLMIILLRHIIHGLNILLYRRTLLLRTLRRRSLLLRLSKRRRLLFWWKLCISKTLLVTL